MMLVIDNYDSFTYNLVDYFQTLGQWVQTFRADQICVASVKTKQPDYLVFSPGPGHPKDATLCFQLLDAFAGKIPILGVCLGHQVIGLWQGGRIIQSPKIMHGYTSMIRHQQFGLFHALPPCFQVTRYHSLALAPDNFPDSLQIDALDVETNTIMAISHRQLPVYGVQFHPESIATAHGHLLLKNFLQIDKNMSPCAKQVVSS